MRNLLDGFKTLLMTLLAIVLLYLVVAAVTFDVRHQKANRYAKFHHFTAWVTFGTVPELQ